MPRILLVDDVVELVLALGRPLMAEHEVLVATSGAEALELVAQKSPDLLVVDLQMPDMDGIEVMTRLRGNPATAAIPVLILTGDERPEVRDSALQAGAADVLLKPVGAAALKTRITMTLARQHARRP